MKIMLLRLEGVLQSGVSVQGGTIGIPPICRPNPPLSACLDAPWVSRGEILG